MIEAIEPQRVPPAVALLQEIQKRRASPAVAVSGLGPVLDVLAAYIVTTEARLAALEKGQ